MPKFLTSRATLEADPEILPELTPKLLRTLVSGDFCLLPIPNPAEGTIPGASECILMLHEKGIFVFLYQQQFGLISGTEHENTWTSTNILGENTFFSSPHLRNKTNIRILADILKLPENQFHSVLVFNSECDVRRAPKTSTLHVLHIEQLEEYFAKLLPRLPLQYTHTQLEALRDIFLCIITNGKTIQQP